MFSLIETIDLLKQIATKHKQINSFGFGDYSDIGTEELLLYVGSNPNKITYPLMFAVPQNVSIEGNETVMPLNILIIDLVHQDNKNREDVLSDTLLIQHDIYALLQDPVNRDNYVLNKTSELKPFYEPTDTTDDWIGGWEATYEFRISNQRDRCAVPLTSSITAQ